MGLGDLYRNTPTNFAIRGQPFAARQIDQI